MLRVPLKLRKKIKRLNIPKLDELAIEHLRRMEVAKQANVIKLLTPKDPSSDAMMEYSFAEIAMKLGMSRKTVSELYASGLNKIVKYLNKNPDVADAWVSALMFDEDYASWDIVVTKKI